MSGISKAYLGASSTLSRSSIDMKKLAGIEMFRTSVALGAGAQVLGSMGVSAAGLGNMGAAMPAVGSIQGAGILLDEVKRLRR